jgi:hypothetical protein
MPTHTSKFPKKTTTKKKPSNYGTFSTPTPSSISQRFRFLPRTNLSPLKKTSFTDLNNDHPHLLPRPPPQQNTNET